MTFFRRKKEDCILHFDKNIYLIISYSRNHLINLIENLARLESKHRGIFKNFNISFPKFSRRTELLLLTWKLCCFSIFLTISKVPSLMTSSSVTVTGTRQLSASLGSGSVELLVSHVCCFISEIVILLSGTLSSIRPIRSRISRDMRCEGNTSGSLRTISWMALPSDSFQGRCPATSAYNVTPIDHTSQG